MKHTAKLHSLPPGVQFPSDLEGKIVFDAASRCLVWYGFMTEAELQQLLQLHTDSYYRCAIASLFEACNRLDTPLTRRLNLTLALLAAVCVIGAVIVLVGAALQKSPTQHDSQHHRSHVRQNVDLPQQTMKHPTLWRTWLPRDRPDGLNFLQGGQHA